MYIPDGFGTMFPYLFVKEAAKYIQFLENAFGAREIGRTTAPDGSVANSRVRIGTTTFMVSDASDRMPPTRGTYYLFVVDADAAFAQATANGAETMFAPMNMPYGDRQSGVIDPAGNIWWVSERMEKRPYDL